MVFQCFEAKTIEKQLFSHCRLKKHIFLFFQLFWSKNIEKPKDLPIQHQKKLLFIMFRGVDEQKTLFCTAESARHSQKRLCVHKVS